MRRHAALPLLLCLMLPRGAHAAKVWFSPDKDSAATAQDRYDCEGKAAKFSYDMGKPGKDKVVSKHFSECMQALGYAFVPEERAHGPARPPRTVAAVRAVQESKPVCGGTRPRALTFVNASTETIWLAQFGNGFSKDCTKDSECGGTNKCVNNWCTGVLCQNDGMCGKAGSTFCQTKPACSTPQSPDCQAISCQKNEDCPFAPASGEACLGATACKTLNDCPAIKCSADADCPDYRQKGQTVKGSCNLKAGLCAQTCEAETASCLCAGGSPCPGGGTCKDNRCTGGAGYCAVNCNAAAGRCACKERADGKPACSGSAACESDGMCTRGGMCRYKTYPTGGEFQPWELSPGSTTVICVPDAWGGRIWPRTGCVVTERGLACKTGDCDGRFTCEVSGDAPSTLFEANYDTKDGSVYYDVSLVDAFNLPLTAETGSPACPTLGSSTDLRGPACPKKLQLLDDDKTTVLGCLSPCAVCNLRKGAPGKALENNPLLATGVDCSPSKVQYYCCLMEDMKTERPSCNMGDPVCFDDNDCGLICRDSENDKDGKNAACGGNSCSGGVCQSMTCGDDHFCRPHTKLCKKDANCNTGEGFGCDLSDPDPSGYGFCRPGAARAAVCCGPVNPAWQSAVKEYVSVFKKAMPTAYSYQYDDPTSLVHCPKGDGVDFTITFGHKK